MAKQIINVGTTANDKKGDSLRIAFQKVNANFGELYTTLDGFSLTNSIPSLTGNSGKYLSNNGSALSWGSIPTDISDLTDATNLLSTVSAAVIVSDDPPADTTLGKLWYDTESGRTYVRYDDNWVDANPKGNIPNLGNVTQHIIPSTDSTYDLGSPERQWRSLYVSTSTIYINGTALSLDESGNILVDGDVYSGGPVNTGNIVFEGDELTNPTNQVINISATDYAQLQSNETYVWVEDGNANVEVNGRQWQFNAQGDIELPNKWPIQFSPVFDAEHYSGNGTFQGDGTASFTVQLAGDGAQFEWMSDDPTFNTNRGYVGQQSFRYTEADHGITGYNLDILMEMNGPDGEGLYNLNVALSPPPGVEDLAKIRSSEELMIKAGNKGWLFDTAGDIYLPASGTIRDSQGNSVLSGGILGLEVNTNLNPTEEGDANYELNINNDIELKIYQDAGDVEGNLGPGISLGESVSSSHRNGVIAIGNNDVGYNSKQGGVYIGAEAGWNDSEGPQGEFAIAIGAFAARNYAEDNSITLNATGEHFDPVGQGFFVKPVREFTATKSLYYNPTTGEIVYNDDNIGSPTISNTVKGFINLVGDRPNEEDDIFFEAVAVNGDYAYVVGGDYYIDDSNSRAKVYKFDLRTGEQVWVKQIYAGRGATFAITISSGTITIDGITQMGEGYLQGEEIPIDGYQVGGNSPENNFFIVVDTVDESGGILTVSVKPGYNAGAISFSSTVNSYYEDAQGDGVSIAYDSNSDQVIVVQEIETGRGDSMDSYWSWCNVYRLDPATGNITGVKTLSDEGDIYPNSTATHASDENKIAVVGEKYNEYLDFGSLTVVDGGVDYVVVAKATLDPEHIPGTDFNYYGDFWIRGTGITNQENIDSINSYPDMPTTVRQGSGAEFTIGNDGGGTFGVTVTNGGTNYLPGHKIRILGTNISGLSPTNDAIITVSTTDAGAITAATVSGTAPGSTPINISGVTGTNYNVGSGFQPYIYVDSTTGAYNYGGSNYSGSNYVPGDVITISGTQFAGGTSPANDATIIVGTVYGGGQVNSIVDGAVAGTGNTLVLRFIVSGVDFGAPGGAWTLHQNLGGEAFVWTPGWSNAIGGGGSTERFYGVTWSTDGNSVYAVGYGRYEVNYDQALVAKFNGTTGALVWCEDIHFDEITESMQARDVCTVPDSTDIIVAGAWYNNDSGRNELILTRITAAGAAVWQKTYEFSDNNNNYYFDYEMSIKPVGDNVVVSLEQNTQDSQGLGFVVVNPDTGSVIRHRVLSADGNSNYNYYNTPTANFADVYGNDIVIAGYTYVPTDNYYNSLLFRLPTDGLVDIDVGERYSLGEHLLSRQTVTAATREPTFVNIVPVEHPNTITTLEDQRNYYTGAPAGELRTWTFTVTDNRQGYLEFGDGSKQAFATDMIPQIPAANDYYLTPQDSGKHIFFEHENGRVWIKHWTEMNLPVGFAFTLVNTTGSDCYVELMYGENVTPQMKLAGRNITTYAIGIPDSGSGSMVTFLKVKQGYTMPNSDGDQDYPDVWMVSGPSDIYNND